MTDDSITRISRKAGGARDVDAERALVRMGAMALAEFRGIDYDDEDTDRSDLDRAAEAVIAAVVDEIVERSLCE